MSETDCPACSEHFDGYVSRDAHKKLYPEHFKVLGMPVKVSDAIKPTEAVLVTLPDERGKRSAVKIKNLEQAPIKLPKPKRERKTVKVVAPGYEPEKQAKPAVKKKKREHHGKK